MDWIPDLFGWVCGQNPAHIWAPGGWELPCCQRCTGLYVGACLAAMLHVWLKPRLSGRFLEVHGLFLLLMVPFGFQWVPQGAALRAATAVWFGFGIVTFLWLVPATRLRPAAWQTGRTSASGCYFVIATGSAALVPAVGSSDKQAAATLLTILVATGLLALVVLAAVNVGVGLCGGLHWLRRGMRRASA